jgi:hypothetical protein
VTLCVDSDCSSDELAHPRTNAGVGEVGIISGIEDCTDGLTGGCAPFRGSTDWVLSVRGTYRKGAKASLKVEDLRNDRTLIDGVLDVRTIDIGLTDGTCCNQDEIMCPAGRFNL